MHKMKAQEAAHLEIYVAELLIKYFNLKLYYKEFPGGLVVRILAFHCCGWGSIPGRGTEIPQAMRRGKNKTKQENCITTFMGPREVE